MCVCMSMYMCVYVYVHVYCVFMCVHMHVRACVLYVYVCVCSYAHAHVYICMCVCAYMYMCMCLCTYVFVCVCMHACMCVSMCMWVCVPQICLRRLVCGGVFSRLLSPSLTGDSSDLQSSDSTWCSMWGGWEKGVTVWPLLVPTLVSRNTLCGDAVPPWEQSSSNFYSAQDRWHLFLSFLHSLYFAIGGTEFRDSHKISATELSSRPWQNEPSSH